MGVEVSSMIEYLVANKHHPNFCMYKKNSTHLSNLFNVILISSNICIIYKIFFEI